MRERDSYLEYNDGDEEDCCIGDDNNGVRLRLLREGELVLLIYVCFARCCRLGGIFDIIVESQGIFVEVLIY